MNWQLRSSQCHPISAKGVIQGQCCVSHCANYDICNPVSGSAVATLCLLLSYLKRAGCRRLVGVTIDYPSQNHFPSPFYFSFTDEKITFSKNLPSLFFFYSADQLFALCKYVPPFLSPFFSSPKTFPFVCFSDQDPNGLNSFQ